MSGRAAVLWKARLRHAGLVRRGAAGQNIQRLEIVDRDNDGCRDISFWTSTNHVFYLNSDGAIIAIFRSDGATGTAYFEPIAPK